MGLMLRLPGRGRRLGLAMAVLTPRVVMARERGLPSCVASESRLFAPCCAKKMRECQPIARDYLGGPHSLAMTDYFEILCASKSWLQHHPSLNSCFRRVGKRPGAPTWMQLFAHSGRYLSIGTVDRSGQRLSAPRSATQPWSRSYSARIARITGPSIGSRPHPGRSTVLRVFRSQLPRSP